MSKNKGKDKAQETAGDTKDEITETVAQKNALLFQLLRLKKITSFSSFATTRTRSSSVATADSTDAVPERMPDCNYYRNLWWDKGELNSKAEWDKVTLPYKLAVGVTLEASQKVP